MKPSAWSAAIVLATAASMVVGDASSIWRSPLTRPRRCLASFILIFSAFIVAPIGAAAAEFPTKPIRFVVPYTPGGTTDLVARTVGQKVSEILKQPVIIENKAGAGGNIGMDFVAKAPPDGYTIGMGAISTNALNPHIYKSMPFDPRKDFTPVGMLGTSTIVVVVPASSLMNTLSDLIATAKKKPGMPYATAGAGTSMNLAGVMFSQMTGVQLTHVAYKGSGPAISDMLGGQLEVMFDNLPASLPHIKAGKLRALAVAGPSRSPQLPDVPTIAETGLKGYAMEPWFAVYGPAKLSPDIVETLNRAVTAALADPAITSKLLEAGFTPKPSTSEDLAKLGQAEYARLGEIAKKANMTAE